MFSSLTGRGPETKGAGTCLVQSRAARCCRLHRKSLPDWLFLSFLLCSLHFQASVIRSGTPHQSASGEPTLWPTSGTRSRPPAKSTRPFRLWLCSSSWRCPLDSHISHFMFFYFPADAPPTPVVQVLRFSNLSLRDPWSDLERPPQAYVPSYSLILRYGLAATLWLCIGCLQVRRPLFCLFHFLSCLLEKLQNMRALLPTPSLPQQVIYFTVFHEHFVEDKIRQFVDLCSISNVSENATDMFQSSSVWGTKMPDLIHVHY